MAEDWLKLLEQSLTVSIQLVFPPKYFQIDPQEGKKNKYIEFSTCSNHVLHETNRNHKVIMLGELMTSERDPRENFSLRFVAFVVMTCDFKRKVIV